METELDDLCRGKELLNEFLKDKPELERTLTSGGPRADDKPHYSTRVCACCDGYNYNCPDYTTERR